MNQAVEVIPPTLMQRHRRALVTAASVAALLGIAVFGSYWWKLGQFLEETDDAYVRADWVAVSPRVAGYVSQVLVDDNQSVKAGEVLVRIDDRDFIERVNSALAQLQQADAAVTAQQASLHILDAQLGEQQQRIVQAQAALASGAAEAQRARLDYQRYRNLVAQHVASAQHLETVSAGQAQAQAALAQARAQVLRQQAQLQVIQARRQQAQAQLQARQARVGEAQAAVGLARNALEDTTIRAPFEGVVGQRKVRRQQYAIPGLPLLAVVPVAQAYVSANFKETQLQRMAPGQPVEIAVDSFSGRHWRGEVQSIAPGSGAVFALLPPDNATGNFTKIVQRFPVRIRLLPQAGDGPRLLPGMSVIATVDTRGEPAHGG